MSYTTITKGINVYNNRNQFTDIYTYAVIKRNSDFKTGISIITIDKLHELTTIPTRTLTEVIKRLDGANELVKIERTPISEHVQNGEYYFKKNQYQFDVNPAHHFFLDNDFFKMDLPVKTKGFLLQLKSVCKNDTNKYISAKPTKNGINKTELANRLNIDTKTLTNLLDECVHNKQIKHIENGLLILNEYFLLSVSKKMDNEIYNTIYRFCIDKGAVPPERDKAIIESIKYKYHVSESTLIQEKKRTDVDIESLKAMHLRTVLNQRCQTLPEYVTLDYFLKVLDVHKPHKAINDQDAYIIL